MVLQLALNNGLQYGSYYCSGESITRQAVLTSKKCEHHFPDACLSLQEHHSGLAYTEVQNAAIFTSEIQISTLNVISKSTN
jgi:hypothetical protein